MPSKLTDENLKRAHVMMPPSMLKQIDEWRRKEEDIPHTSEAIRRLLTWALEASKRGRLESFGKGSKHGR